MDSAGTYYLKKVSREEIFLKEMDEMTTMLGISKVLGAEFALISRFDFFKKVYFGINHHFIVDALIRTYKREKRHGASSFCLCRLFCPV